MTGRKLLRELFWFICEKNDSDPLQSLYSTTFSGSLTTAGHATLAHAIFLDPKTGNKFTKDAIAVRKQSWGPPKTGTDFNDVLKEGGTALVRRLLSEAKAYELKHSSNGFPAQEAQHSARTLSSVLKEERAVTAAEKTSVPEVLQKERE